MMDVEDEELIGRIAQGDHAAFGILVRRYHGDAYRVAVRVLNDGTQAEDVVQDAFLKLWQGKAVFDPARGQFQAWFRRVIVNQCLDARRRLRVVAPLDEAFDLADDGPTPERNAQSRESNLTIESALAALPVRQRAAIALFYGEGHSMSETAGLLDLSVKAVESLLSRGRAALKERLMIIREEIGS